jgi:hypothetical protein
LARTPLRRASRVPLRLGLLVLCVVVAAAFVGWRFWPGEARQASALPAVSGDQKLSRAEAGDFRATVCASTPCVLVEAGGLAFLVGAGQGAAEWLQSSGLLRADLDAVLLTDLSSEQIEGLPAIRNLTWLAGRKAPLNVYGPVGVAGVADGVNLMLASADAREIAAKGPDAAPPAGAALAAGRSGQADGRGGVSVFDSGVVSISSFPLQRQTGGADWFYRFDFGGQTLVVAGCGVGEAELAVAIRGAREASAVVAAAGEPGRRCAMAEELVATFGKVRIARGVLAPLYPLRNASTEKMWAQSLKLVRQANTTLGEPGVRLVMPVKAED